MWHRGGTERPEPRSRRLIADMGDLGERAWFLVVEVLRAPGKGEEGAWAWVEWHCRSLPTMLWCDGRESGVSMPAGRVHAAPTAFALLAVRGLDGSGGRPTAHANEEDGVDGELFSGHLQHGPHTHVLGIPHAHCVRCGAMGGRDTHDGSLQQVTLLLAPESLHLDEV
jgi:hypothetical protein